MRDNSIEFHEKINNKIAYLESLITATGNNQTVWVTNFYEFFDKFFLQRNWIELFNTLSERFHYNYSDSEEEKKACIPFADYLLRMAGIPIIPTGIPIIPTVIPTIPVHQFQGMEDIIPKIFKIYNQLGSYFITYTENYEKARLVYHFMEIFFQHNTQATAIINHQMGYIFRRVRKHDEAIDYFNRALTRYDNTQEVDRVTTLLHLGSTYRDRYRDTNQNPKDLQEAEKYLDLSFQTTEAILESPNFTAEQKQKQMVSIMHCQGQLYRLQNKLAEAKTMFEKTLEIKRRIYGDIHSDVGIALQELGTTLGLHSEHKLAIDYLSKAVKILEQCHPSKTAHRVAFAVGELGYYGYYLGGEYKTAVSTLQDAKERLLAALRNNLDHSDIQLCQEFLAVASKAYQAQQDRIAKYKEPEENTASQKTEAAKEQQDEQEEISYKLSI